MKPLDDEKSDDEEIAEGNEDDEDIEALDDTQRSVKLMLRSKISFSKRRKRTENSFDSI